MSERITVFAPRSASLAREESGCIHLSLESRYEKIRPVLPEPYASSKTALVRILRRRPFSRKPAPPERLVCEISYQQGNTLNSFFVYGKGHVPTVGISAECLTEWTAYPVCSTHSSAMCVKVVTSSWPSLYAGVFCTCLDSIADAAASSQTAARSQSNAPVVKRRRASFLVSTLYDCFYESLFSPSPRKIPLFLTLL